MDSPTRMTTTAEMTLDDADQVLAEIFQCRLSILRIEADAEAKIAPFKEAAEDASKPLQAELERLTAALEGFVYSHASAFEKPRMRATQWGSYGMRASSSLQIRNEHELIAWAKRTGNADLVKTVESVVKPAITKRIKAGERIPGASIKTTDTPEYKLDTAVLQAEL